MAHGIGVAIQTVSDGAHRGIAVLPHPERFEEYLALLVGKVAETVQSGADRFDHHIRDAGCGGGQNGAVEHRYRGSTVGPAPHCDFREVESMRRIAQVVESRADADAVYCR